MTTALLWGDTILIGLWLGASEAAVYTSATRLVWLGVVFYVPIGLAFQPLVLSAWSRGPEHLIAITSAASKWVFLTAALPLSLLAISADDVLRMVYGPGYVSGSLALGFLSVGQILEAGTGAVALVILTTGHSRATLAMASLALFVDMVLNFALIPRYGISGAGFAWAASLGVLAAMRIVHARRFIGGSIPVPGWLVWGSVSLMGAVFAAVFTRFVLSTQTTGARLVCEVTAALGCYLWLLTRFRVMER